MGFFFLGFFSQSDATGLYSLSWPSDLNCPFLPGVAGGTSNADGVFLSQGAAGKKHVSSENKHDEKLVPDWLNVNVLAAWCCNSDGKEKAVRR